MKRALTILLAASLGVAGCGDAEVDELPEVAEVEADEMQGLEYDEELVLDAADIGETILATGWVSGLPLDTGFFLRTEGNRLIFVSSEAEVASGDAVRVVGTLLETTVADFEGWEMDAFEDEIEAEWDFDEAYYIDATSTEMM